MSLDGLETPRANRRLTRPEHQTASNLEDFVSPFVKLVTRSIVANRRAVEDQTSLWLRELNGSELRRTP